MIRSASSVIRRVVNRIRGNRIAPPPELPAALTARCEAIRDQKLTFLTKTSLHSLVDLVCEIERNEVPGRIIEAGCALGGSAIAMSTAKSESRPLDLYDTFEMIPPPTEKDGKDVHDRYETIRKGEASGIDGEAYYGYLKDIPERVTASFANFGRPIDENNVSLHKGLLQDTMSIDDAVALAHIDVDWYEPVYVCLERIVPKLSPGGAIVLDDYFAWSGCRSATDDFFSTRKKQFRFSTAYGHMVVRHRDP